MFGKCSGNVNFSVMFVSSHSGVASAIQESSTVEATTTKRAVVQGREGP